MKEIDFTATDRILDVQVKLIQICNQINEAKRPPEITTNEESLPGVVQETNRNLSEILQHLEDAMKQLNKIREDLADGTQELI